MPASPAAEAIGIVKDLMLTVAAFVGMLVAVTGLGTWNRQLKGGVEYELTRRLLKCTYRLRETIRQVRYPLIAAEEKTVPDTEATLPDHRKNFIGIANCQDPPGYRRAF